MQRGAPGLLVELPWLPHAQPLTPPAGTLPTTVWYVQLWGMK